MKIVSWNVNGIRAAVKKGFSESMAETDADIICLQETKAQPEQVEEALDGMEGYSVFANSAEKKGYSSTAILTRKNPVQVIEDMGIDEHDNEGRVITAEYEDFYLVTVYTPNSGRGLVRLEYRGTWDADFLSYVKKLEESKPVIICGDLNVAHQPIDLANPKNNYNKTAGYTQQEIDGFSALLDAGFVDVFRFRNPEAVVYTYWNYMFNARKRNVGWRIDYFLLSESLLSRVADCHMLTEVLGSDHCPIYLTLS